MSTDDSPSQKGTEFVTARDRDAWGVIRGFVYQVDLTILRWLGLLSSQSLELERGEYIDLISQSLQSGDSTRLLEQIKHRIQPISLRSPVAITSLACALEHKNTNPELNLLFRFTTNAEVAAEKVSLIKASVPGVSMWEDIRNARVTAKTQSQYLAEIRAILKNIECPLNLNNQTWQQFHHFIDSASDSSLKRFIQSFEWGTGQSSAKQTESDIKSLLIARGDAEDESQAKEKYERLFLYVFKLLSTKDVKRLTTDILAQQLMLPTLSHQDRELLAILREKFRDLETRVATLEQGLSSTNAAMLQIQNTVEASLFKSRSAESIKILPNRPLLAPPPEVNQLSRRTATVDRLSEALHGRVWLAIHGSAGVGKTQLALLLTRREGKCRAWVRFRDLEPPQSYAHAIRACEVLSGCIFDSGQKRFFEQVCSALGKGSLLVLDDLPRLIGSEEFSDFLIQLALASRDAGVQIISSSHWPLPSRVSEALGESVLNVQSPPLDDTEAREILTAYGAPQDKLNDKFVRYLNSLTSQHPALLSAAARFLAQKRWRFTEEALTQLIKGQYTGEITEETVSRLLQTIEDNNVRELLYRLKLIWGRFSRSDVELLANVKPIIRRANEKLHPIIGLWIQRETETEFSVSPLVKTIGEGFLAQPTEFRCHDVLGKRLFNKKKVRANDLWEAFGHFWSAKEFGRASAVIVLALGSLQRASNEVDDFGFLDLGIHSPLSEEFELGMRIYLRTLQISARARFKRPNDYLLNDLDALIQKASSKEGWAVTAAAISLNALIANDHPQRANTYLLKTLALNPDLVGPTGEKLRFPKGLGLEFLFWTSTSAIRNANDLRDWLSTIEQLTTKQRSNVFNVEYGHEGASALTERLWVEERKKPLEKQQWDIVLQSLDQLIEWGSRFEFPILAACATRTKISVLAEEQHNLEAAISLGQSFLARTNLDSNARFLIKEILGREYATAKQNKMSLQWLNSAFSEETQGFELERIGGFLIAAIAVGEEDPNRSIEYASRAVAVARKTRMAQRILVISLGEMAIAEWLAARPFESIFKLWEEAAEHLLEIKRKNESWKALYMVFGHISGFFAYLTHEGKAPEKRGNNEVYCPPKRGMLWNFKTEAASLYDSAKDLLLPAQLTIFASAVGLDSHAVTWALRGIDGARKKRHYQVLPVFASVIIPSLLNENRFSDALDLALEAATITVACAKYGKKTLPLGADELNVNETLGPKPNSNWNEVESFTVTTGVLPVALRISITDLQSKESSRTCASEACDACRKIAGSASNPDLWAQAAELIAAIFVDRLPGKELVEKGMKFENQSLLTIAYIGASLQDDLSLNSDCRLHLVAMPYLDRSTRAERLVYRQLAVPFISQFWAKAFTEKRFQFSMPRILEGELASLRQVNPERRALAILRAISSNLNVKLSEQDKEWLGTA